MDSESFNSSQNRINPRLNATDGIARMALVLASDLSSYVHGALIVVDGGFLSA